MKTEHWFASLKEAHNQCRLPCAKPYSIFRLHTNFQQQTQLNTEIVTSIVEMLSYLSPRGCASSSLRIWALPRTSTTPPSFSALLLVAAPPRLSVWPAERVLEALLAGSWLFGGSLFWKYLFITIFFRIRRHSRNLNGLVMPAHTSPLLKSSSLLHLVLKQCMWTTHNLLLL